MSDYQIFSQSIKKKTGIDLTLYKEVQMKRRLTSLRDKKGFSDFNSYYQALVSNKELMEEFLDKMTINVSEFYRNSSRWNILENKILPDLLKKNRKLKIWSAACSTGDEPYTIAMMLSQYVDLDDVSILATDIDDKILERAKKGIYTERALKEVPPKLKEKFFKKDGSLYTIDDKIKSAITFKKHNLLSDPYPSNFDLIVCRNVLIYFTEEAKTTIYEKFSRALVEQGVFFVGSTEQIFNPNKYDFKVVDTFFYQKNI
ncbi:chemotaxis protein methyltransferase [Paraliobacillus quinghaiensis]|uniref:protein-glutamate O-methyltransferase n=1 Tax=Paraliobacillus quinghaiensis TaxID=470815 RepID=A0A917THR8_9BACI|nr:protein-glutamate O-methyltransferase CheR [Paraliobacillus quinghaiensis]GGM22859.1 chemotaxis protein methyltransferase [Paraliobacillus quinghaiensis]